MKQKDFAGIVPPHYTGKEIEAYASIELSSESEARNFYERVKNRLLNVNDWHKIAGMMSAEFQVMDKNGKEVSREAQKGDYLKIDIPGPGSKEGDGYDWVYIEELREINQEHVQSTGFRVRPTQNPFGKKNETAHFYSDESTSSFIVTLEHNKITAYIIDRNTKPNDDTESLSDKIRHTTVGMSAIATFSKIQWQKLADGLVENK